MIPMNDQRRNSLLWAALAIGVGLALAPVVFQMFSRAPAGGEMIDLGEFHCLVGNFIVFLLFLFKHSKIRITPHKNSFLNRKCKLHIHVLRDESHC